MPIAPSDIQWHRAALLSDTTPAQNGGRPTASEIISGVKNNFFPDVSAAQRAAGAEHWRKAFILIQNADDLPLIDPRISIEQGTPGDSHVLIYPGTWTDTQATRSGRPYGFGALADPAIAGDIEITVTSEADFSGLADLPFQEGDTLRLDARENVSAEGEVEYVEIDSISYAGSTLTIGLAEPLANGYAAGSAVASVIAPGDLAASVTDTSVTGLTYDDTGHAIVVPQVGGVYQTWTVTVTDAATGALAVVGDTLGPVGTGSTGVDLAPANPDGGVYFRLESDGWGGTPADGDTLVFTTVPAGCALWYRRIVPAGAAAIASDPVAVCIEGESP